VSVADGLYVGEVVHERFAPRRHRLNYRIFQMLIDIDAAPLLAKRLKFFSYNRPGLFSLHDKDHGDRSGRPLRAFAEESLQKAGLAPPGGQILIQCMPRVLGYVFNPLTLFYCHDDQGRLAAMIYEVHNTFGQRHSYVIPVAEDEGAPHDAGKVRQSCGKVFHVSPFMGMDMSYNFTIAAPGENVSTVIQGLGADGKPLIFAGFKGARRPLSDGQLLRLFVTYPLMTLKVTAAIHLEAVKLLLKGLRLKPAPPAPTRPVTLGVAAP
jgi:DUF1365 family protein